MEAIAAIAAGMFAVLDPAALGKNGGTSGDGSQAVPARSPSNWKQRGRSETLR